jgi:hypothetical protein
LEEIGSQFQFPMKIKCENDSAIYLANNHFNRQSTTHNDKSRHYFCEWVEDDIFNIIFTPPLEDTADMFTNNPTEETFTKHADNLNKTIPKGTEMCNGTTFPNQDIIFESQQNEVQDKLSPSNAMIRAIFDSNDQNTKQNKRVNLIIDQISSLSSK